MSSTSNSTQYSIAIGVSSLQQVVNVQIVADQEAGFGDNEALALFQALIAAFPSSWGAAAGASMEKVQGSQTMWSANLSAAPPAFQ